MWEAMSNALGCVAPNGKALIALYSRPRFAPMQVAMKRLYNGSSNSLFRMTLKLLWATLWLSMELVGARRNPVRFVRDYAALNRGMSFWRDVEDWVGGWPFEFASASQVAERLPAGYAIERQNIAPRGACSEYLIARRA
jgi:2-polyprenyl-6-hydroxyphenyl methylase/3-demethylubiquinone-9 3-methyltransferase